MILFVYLINVIQYNYVKLNILILYLFSVNVMPLDSSFGRCGFFSRVFVNASSISRCLFNRPSFVWCFVYFCFKNVECIFSLAQISIHLRSPRESQEKTMSNNCLVVRGGQGYKYIPNQHIKDTRVTPNISTLSATTRKHSIASKRHIHVI